MHQMPFGAQLAPGGGVRFRLWAPQHERIGLAIEGRTHPLEMTPQAGGWHELTTDLASAGTRYRYVIPGGLAVPDPASRFQPLDVHGPSEVIDADAFAWGDHWTGRPWNEAVIYELHVGTFTTEGTFRGAMARLDHLRRLGVTALEIMPVADFPGRFNWGYDGVLWFAPDSTYGRPGDFKALVREAHARGVMVLLDVVYNHFGPEGNYLCSYAPQFFTARHSTPWGDAVNFDGEQCEIVREFVIHNALYWLEEYQLDGLRLDAVHAIRDDSPKHIGHELCERARAQIQNRPVHLILENEENHPEFLSRCADGRPKWFTAQWNDDVHHVLHSAATGEGNGYYSAYLGDTGKLGRALAEGFAFQGEIMTCRGRARGAPSRHLPPASFLAFLQNHDQTGNRAFGERIGRLASTPAVRAAASVYLLLPQIPMLFMGEEWNAEQPFLFFSDFCDDLAEAVRRGRRQEFARFPQFQDPVVSARIPDPQSAASFRATQLNWGQIEEPSHAGWLEWYRSILRMRREKIITLLPQIGGESGCYEILGAGAVHVRWRTGSGEELHLAANLSDVSVPDFPEPARSVLWRENAPPWGAPWSVCWWIA